MKKMNLLALIILSVAVLSLVITAVFFHFYTYNEEGGILGEWRTNESLLYLGTARHISAVCGILIILSIVLLFASQDKLSRGQYIPGVLIVALSSIAIIGSLTSFFPCTEMMRMTGRPMRCYWTMKVLLGITGAISVSGVLMVLFCKSKEFINGLNTVLVMLSCLLLIMPARLTEGFCSTVMSCTEKYHPFTTMMAWLILVVSLVNAFLLFKKTKMKILS